MTATVVRKSPFDHPGIRKVFVADDEYDDYYEMFMGMGCILKEDKSGKRYPILVASTYEGFQALCSGLAGDSLILHRTDIGPENLVDPVYTVATKTEHFTLGIYLYTGVVISNKDSYSCFMCLVGDGRAAMMLGKSSIPKSVNIATNLGEVFGSEADVTITSGGSSLVVRDTPILMKGSDEELTAFLSIPKLPAISTLGSVAYSLFPFARSEIESMCSVIPFRNACAMLGAGVPEIKKGKTKAHMVEYQTRTTMFLLSPGYSQDVKYESQVYRRYTAIMGSLEMEPVSEQDFKTILGRSQVVRGNKVSSMDRLLGYVLARDKNCKYNPQVLSQDLWDNVAATEAQELTEWANALYDQAKLVYEGTHSVTIGFAIGSLALIENVIKAMGDPWVGELKILKEAADMAKDRPFNGLVAGLAEQRRLAKWPRLALIGALYHKRTLTEAEDLQDFEAYKIDAIVDKVNNSKDVQTIHAIVSILPESNIVGIATLVIMLPLGTARRLMDGKTDEVKMAVATYISSHENPLRSPWAIWYRRELTKQDKARIQKETGPVLEKALARVLATVADQINLVQSNNVRNSLRDSLFALRRKIEDKMNAGVKLIESMSAPQYEMMEDEFIRMVDEQQEILDSIHDLNFERVMENAGVINRKEPVDGEDQSDDAQE